MTRARQGSNELNWPAALTKGATLFPGARGDIHGRSNFKPMADAAESDQLRVVLAPTEMQKERLGRDAFFTAAHGRGDQAPTPLERAINDPLRLTTVESLPARDRDGHGPICAHGSRGEALRHTRFHPEAGWARLPL